MFVDLSIHGIVPVTIAHRGEYLLAHARTELIELFSRLCIRCAGCSAILIVPVRNEFCEYVTLGGGIATR